jgi:hypothetical protein
MGSQLIKCGKRGAAFIGEKSAHRLQKGKIVGARWQLFPGDEQLCIPTKLDPVQG